MNQNVNPSTPAVHGVPGEPDRNEASHVPLSGVQYHIVSGDYRATIASVGATLRALSYDGRDLIASYPANSVRPGYRGALLAPWPNRVIGGRYAFAGVNYELDLNEPGLGNAIHGLVQWLDWQPVEQTIDSVTLTAKLQASTAYPFRLKLTATYSLSESGLRVDVHVINTGDATAPYGLSTHPYFIAPGDPDTWRVTLNGTNVLTVDERLAPADLVPVDDGDGRFDLRPGAEQLGPELHGRFIDNAYTGIARDSSGRGVVTLVGEDGHGVAIEFGEAFGWAQVYTGALNSPDGPSVAVEPMTCPPNAFASGEDVISIDPDAEVTHDWRIRAI